MEKILCAVEMIEYLMIFLLLFIQEIIEVPERCFAFQGFKQPVLVKTRSLGIGGSLVQWLFEVSKIHSQNQNGKLTIMHLTSKVLFLPSSTLLPLSNILHVK